MTQIRLRFKSLHYGNQEGALFYQISHNGLYRLYPTTHKIYEWEWDKDKEEICLIQTGRRHFLEKMCERIYCDFERINAIIKSLRRQSDQFSVVDIINKFKEQTARLSLFNFMDYLIGKKIAAGKIRTGETYRCALNCFKRFRNNVDVMFDEIDKEMMEDYENYLKEQGLIPNSSSFHMRILRAAYHRACDEGLVYAIGNPFSRVYTGVDKTPKRAVDINTIIRIKNVDLSGDKWAEYARDMFMLSFYLRGISFIDIAFLKKTDLKNGRIKYRRRKTGQHIEIKWTKEMESILKKYPENMTEYLFPIITSPMADERNQYRSRQHKVNSNLKTVGQKIGLDIPLTTYVARHSWASIALAKGVSISVISEGLGHENEKTTRIYLSSLNNSAVDKANDLILSSLE